MLPSAQWLQLQTSEALSPVEVEALLTDGRSANEHHKAGSKRVEQT